jgi:CMP-N-acetylneuraminate monooxygenase
MKEKIFSIEIDRVKPGVNFLNGRKLILYWDGLHKFTATRNKCRHQGGSFVEERSKSCVVRCPNHDWKLNLSTMEFENPAGGLKAFELEVCESHGRIDIYENIESIFAEKTPRQSLLDGEFQLKFYAHACMAFRAGETTLFTDPWLYGPSFSLGWWLQHQPPDTWLEDLSSSNAIYISHNHSDHLNTHTLKKLFEKNRNVKFIVPAFSSGSVEQPLRVLGFSNIEVLPFGSWMTVGRDLDVMILPDGTGRDDSGILVRYKGHTVLNNVDCGNLNKGDLPQDVDVFLSAFASGASGFPVCWAEMYGPEKIKQIVTRNRRVCLKSVVDLAHMTNAKVVVPFAGYFKEAHKNDQEIRQLNAKNSPDDVLHALQASGSAAKCWIPSAGGVFDLASMTETWVGSFDRSLESYEIEKFEADFSTSIPSDRSKSKVILANYYRKSGFHGNLVLHIIETDDLFEKFLDEHMFDFSTMEIVNRRPDREHQYSRIKIRSAVFWHTINNGLPWEEFSIGFQARFYREPDIYEFDFWTHFQNKLPPADVNTN